MERKETASDRSRTAARAVFRVVLLPAMFLCAITGKPVFQWPALAALAVWLAFEVRALAGNAGKTRDENGRPERARCLPGPADGDRSVILQLNRRITQRLRTEYPETAWLWLERPGAEDLRRGGIWRIRLLNADPFDCAEVTLRDTGGMEIALMRVLPFRVPAGAPADGAGAPELPGLPGRYDVRQWYGRTGEAVLDGLIDELDSQGYRQLQITEDGTVTVSVRDGEQSFSSIGAFPPKNGWEELCALLAGKDIRASVRGNGIALAW